MTSVNGQWSTGSRTATQNGSKENSFYLTGTTEASASDRTQIHKFQASRLRSDRLATSSFGERCRRCGGCVVRNRCSLCGMIHQIAAASYAPEDEWWSLAGIRHLTQSETLRDLKERWIRRRTANADVELNSENGDFSTEPVKGRTTLNDPAHPPKAPSDGPLAPSPPEGRTTSAQSAADAERGHPPWATGNSGSRRFFGLEITPQKVWVGIVIIWAGIILFM